MTLALLLYAGPVLPKWGSSGQFNGCDETGSTATVFDLRSSPSRTREQYPVAVTHHAKRGTRLYVCDALLLLGCKRLVPLSASYEIGNFVKELYKLLQYHMWGTGVLVLV